MNKLVIGLSAMFALLLIPLTSLSGKKSADVKTVHTQDVITLPVTKDAIPFTQVEVKNLDTNNSSLIQLNTEVTEESVNTTINAIKKANDKNVNAIYLLIDSPGGSVYDGARLITAMESSVVPIYTVCTELCASMAAHILEHGSQRYMIDRTKIMFHPATTSLNQEGEVDKIYSRLGSSKRFIDKLDYYVARRAGQTYEDFKAKSMREYWSDAEDALADHLIDGIVTIDFVKEVPPGILFGNNLKLDLRN